jgi:CHAT domain-containing protein
VELRLAFLLALGLATAPVAAQTPPSAGVAVGDDLGGASCVMRERTDIRPSPTLPRESQLFCGERLAGAVGYALVQPQAATADADAALLKQALNESRTYAGHLARLDCKASIVVTDGSAPVIVVPCRTKSGGFPDLIVAGRQGNALAIAQGSAAVYPVLRTAIGNPAPTKTRAELVARLQEFWGEPVVLASAVDIARLKQLLADARVATSLARYDEADGLFRQALALQTQLFSDNDVTAADILMDLALNVSNLGRADEATALFRRAAPFMEKSPREEDRARLSIYRGYEAANRGNFEDALKLGRASTAAWRRVATAASAEAGAGGPGLPGGNSAAQSAALARAAAARGELAMALNFEALMQLRTGDVESAAALAGEALLILDDIEGEPKWWKADVMSTLGDVSIGQGRISAAETYFRAALALRHQLFGEGTGTLRARIGLGRAYASEKMNTSAIIAYREAFAAARALPRGAVPFTANDLAPFAGAIVGYAETLSSYEEKQGLYTEAFDAFQLVRSAAVDKTIANTAARLAAADPAIGDEIRKLQEVERALGLARLKLAGEQALPVQERSGEVEANLAAEIKKLAEAARDQRFSLEAKFPDYATLNDPRPLKLDDVRARLATGEAVMSFLIGRQRSFAQVVRRDGVYIAEVNGGQTAIRDNVAALRKTLEIQGGSIGDFDLKRANQLYTDLFGKLPTSALEGIERLVVVPTGPLASLPFGLLVASAPTSDDYARADWLAKRFSLATTPSLAAFVQLRSTRPAKTPDLPLLAFGDPVLGPSKPAAQRAAASQMEVKCRTGEPMPAALLRGMTSLPDTATELRAVARALGAPESSLNLGAAAREERLRSAELSRYRVLYFATHGLLPNELKCQSEPGLVLTPPAETATERALDGLLEANEVASLSLNADLVVLSACNTAAGGGGFGGEALSGLSEAFFFAGARNLVVTHWQVPSAATTRLMTGMFGGIGAKPPADALRTAQLALASDPKTAHPFFWAAFVVMGDGGNPPQQVAEVAR